MATRQYIGARYVIKVYENTQNPESAEWQSGTSYEPLTMVTYQNSSYLSKKAVPSTVGNPADNPSYWVVTGAYNGQIAHLQSEIDNIESIMESGYVNVLTLGVKNDGSEDCSSIINSNSNKPLYFPAGTYRMDSTLHLSHSIKGEGIPKSWKPNKFDGTIFNFTATDSSDAISYTGNANEFCKEIGNISIQLNGTGKGIDLNTSNCTFYIHDVGILNVKNIGIHARPTEGASRFLQVRNVDIWGVYASPTSGSIGIKVESNSYDSIIENAYIMGIQTGIDVQAGYCKIMGGHIWCAGGSNDASYYNATRCINFNASEISICNLYFDSAVVLIGGLGVKATITNCFAYWGGGVELNSSFHQPTLFGNVNVNSVWGVDNFIVSIPFNAFIHAINPNNIKGSPIINGFSLYSTFSYGLAVKCGEKNNSYTIDYKVADGHYAEVARIPYYGSILVNLGNWLMLVTGRGSGNDVEYIKIGTGVNVYFKDAGGYLKIYVYVPDNWYCRVTALTAGCVNPTYTMFNNNRIVYDQQDDTTGLTSAIEKQWINT